MPYYQTIRAIALLLLPILSLATTVERANFDDVVDWAREHPNEAQAALKTLRAVVEQKTADAAARAATVGLNPADLNGIAYTSRAGRVAALYAIGQLRSPEAIAYLEGLSGDDFVLEDRVELWSAARISLLEVRLDEIGDSPGKARFLEDIVVSKDHDRFVLSRVVLWASEQLCNSGMLPSLHVVQGFLNEFEEPGRAQEQSQFCELRMRAIASSPDRVTALSSVLQVTDRLPHHELIRWAIHSLSSMDDPRALEALANYESAVLELPVASPLRAPLMGYADEIRFLNSSRMAPPTVDDPSRGHIIE